AEAILGVGLKQATASIVVRLFHLLVCRRRRMATKQIVIGFTPFILLCLAVSAMIITVDCGGSPSNASTNTTSPQPALSITTGALLSGTADSAYEASLTASGGEDPYHWIIFSGTLA